MKIIGASLFIVVALVGCIRIMDAAEPHFSSREAEAFRASFREAEAFRTYMDTVVAKDRKRVYRLHYTITKPWMTKGKWSGASDFRVAPDGTFDIAPLIQSSGGIPSNHTTAVYDSQHRTIEFTDVGPNIWVVAVLFRPMYPDFCRPTRIKVARR